MNQHAFTRRVFLNAMGAAAAVAAGAKLSLHQALAAEPLRIWTIGVAKVGAKPGTGGKDWSDMAAQAGTELAYNAKSGSADQAIQKMVVGDGNKLYDAITDNGRRRRYDPQRWQSLRGSLHLQRRLAGLQPHGDR
jgi:hypothetical protein